MDVDAPTVSTDGGLVPPSCPVHGFERPGDLLGPYTLLSVLGEGGFGTVWLAERREPMVQRVAIKIIKAGMDSRSVVARFEHERQALAVMDHPNVARVFDGGVTDLTSRGGGRPYLVMEHVQGEPITTFCDRHAYTIRQRLELFIPVCEAVQHAHMKGIIHRDIKPSNILVELIDGSPIVKVIDFGISKAITQAEGSNTAFTQQGVVIGTPEYMSPEQVSGEADIDTRADVYSLGVVLYQLLTGALPFDSAALRRAGMAEVQRVIRNQTPPKPSTRLSQEAGDRPSRVALERSSTHDRLTAELRRELDWIPLMALRKERDRRYESAAALADDVRRYMAGLPLVAAPDSRLYLARKFVRRNRVQIVAAAAVFMALSLGLVASLWQANEAAIQRDAAVLAGQREFEQRSRADERADAAEKAEAAATVARDAERARADELKQVSDFQSSMLSQVDPTTAGVRLTEDVNRRFAEVLEKGGVPESDRVRLAHEFREDWLKLNATDAARALIDETILRPAVKVIDERFSDQPLVDAQLRQALANRYRGLGLYGEAMPLQESALATRLRVLGEEHVDTVQSLIEMGMLLHDLGRLEDAESHVVRAMELSQRVWGDDDPITITSTSVMASLLQDQGKLDQAMPLLQDVLERRRRTLGDDHPATLGTINDWGMLLLDAGRYEESESFLREGLNGSRHRLGEAHRDTLTSLNNLAGVLQQQGKLSEAEPLFFEVMDRLRRLLGEEHPETLDAINNVGNLLVEQGRLEDASRYCREAMEQGTRVLGDEHPSTLYYANNVASLLFQQGAVAEAEALHGKTLAIRRRVMGDGHPETITSMNNVGLVLRAQGRLAEAEPYLREAVEQYRRGLGDEHLFTLVAQSNLGSLMVSQGKIAEAEEIYRAVLETSRRVFGNDHPDTCISISDLGSLLLIAGRNQEAVDLLAPAEPSARVAFAGGDPRLLATFLSILARARVALGYDPDRFALAESNLLEAHPIFVTARGTTHKDTLECVHGLVDLYVAWNAAEPGKGYDAKAAEWKAKATISRGTGFTGSWSTALDRPRLSGGSVCRAW